MTSAVGSRQTVGAHAGLFARGIAMGLAEVVPGVSGGTIAFITGIYDELLETLASLSRVASTWRNGWPVFWQAHNLAFLVVLCSGMLAGAFGLAWFMLALLEAQPTLVSAFFFGVIAASAVLVGMASSWRWLATLGVVGVAGGVVVAMLGDAGSATATPTNVFVGGAFAATAWVLPGVSGAFVLLLMGLYEPVLRAATQFDLGLLAPLVGGLVVGLLAFSRLLAWLLARARHAVLALLTGLMSGSLIDLWPWRDGEPGVGTVALVATMVVGALIVGGVAHVARQSG